MENINRYNSVDFMTVYGHFMSVHAYTDGSVKTEKLITFHDVNGNETDTTIYTESGNFIPVRMTKEVRDSLLSDGLNSDTDVDIVGTLMTEIGRGSGITHHVIKAMMIHCNGKNYY